MGAHDSLKSLVRQYIKTNGQNEITGQILQNVLIAMIDDLGIAIDPVPTNGSPNAVASGGVYNALKAITDFLNNGYYFVGIAGTSTVPDSVTQYDIFYIASDGGTYTNFLNGDDEPLTLYQGLNILYKGVEDDGWNYFEVFKFSDFVDTTQQQSLSSQQKAQARTNIAAVSYEQQSLDAEQQVQAQNNMMGKAYAPAQNSGLGKVYLDKNNGVLTQAMMPIATQEGEEDPGRNTVYVIQYDFELSEDITIPKNCVLQFDGGSISGGYTLTGNNTTIKADDIHCFNLNVNFAGTWIGAFNIYWLGLVSNDNTFNNAPIIQKALRTFSDTYIPKGIYYCSTTIDASPHTVGMYSEYPKMTFICDGELIYTVQNTSNTFIQIGSYGGIIKIHSIIGPNNNITNDSEKSIGLSLYDCNGASIYVNGISGFYKDVEFLGGTGGFAYNDITISNLGAALILAHLNNVEGGWVNSNRFKFLRMYAYGGQTKPDTAILVKGIDGGYGFNDNVFEKISIEGINKSGAGAPIKLTKCSDVIIGPFRNENNNTPFVHVSGDVKNINLIPNYYAHNTGASYRISASQGATIEYTKPLEHEITWRPFSNCPIVNGKFISLSGYTLDLSNEIPLSAPGYSPIIALFKRNSVINNPIVLKKPSSGATHVAYYDENYNLLNQANYTNYKPISTYGVGASPVDSKVFASTTNSSFDTVLIPDLPNEVKYVGIGTGLDPQLLTSTPDNEFTFKFYSNIRIGLVYRNSVSVWNTGLRKAFNISGTSGNRNSNNKTIGTMNFDITLGKPIWYKGDDITVPNNPVEIWVDATGTPVKTL